MSKKILSLIAVVSLLLTTVTANIASALNLPTMTIESVEGYIGESVDVGITLQNNPGFSAASIKFEYDSTRIKLTDALLCSGFAAGATVSYDNLPYLTFVKAANTTDSDFLKLTFKILDTAALGDAEINVLYNEGDISNRDEDDVNFEIVKGKVTVKQRPVSVTGVTLDYDTLSLDTGANKTAALTATVDPNKATNKAVTWKSSDETVVTVVDGVVTAVKQGTATITVKTVDGGFTAVCVVTVACAHTAKTLTTAKTANCQEGGWDAYYTCDDCGQLFAADGITKISAIPTTNINSGNHTNVQFFAADTATCVHMGNNAYEKCADCGVVTSGSDTRFYGEHSYGAMKTAVSEEHTTENLAPAVAAHYQCSVCQKYFTEAKIETTLEALTGITPSHSYGNWINTDADKHWKECGCGNKTEIAEHNYDNSCDTTCNTCGHIRTVTHTWNNTWSTDGTNHWRECSVCHNARTDEGKHTGGAATCKAKAICSVCHSEYGEYAVCDFTENIKSEYLKAEATCQSPAVYYKSCTVCGKKSTETFEYGTANENNHANTEIRNTKKPTESEKGYTGDTWCLDCNKQVSAGTEIEKKEHKPTKVPAKPATVDEEGNIEYYYCESCDRYYSDADGNIEISKEDTVIAKLIQSFDSSATDSSKNTAYKISPKTGEEGKTAFLLCVSAFSVIGISIVFLRKKKFDNY